MRTEIKEVQGIDWFDGAIMNCLWKGPRLRDILLEAGIDAILMHEKGYKGHVAFASYEKPCQDEAWYGGSVPLERCMDIDGDAILALEVYVPLVIKVTITNKFQMNGNPLTPAHGFPLRIIIPGVLGARSVKWLNRITLQLDHSSSFYQQYDYKILPPEATDTATAKNYWDRVPPMVFMPVNSIVGIPSSNSIVQLDGNGQVEIKGWAVPAGLHGPIRRVEVSTDGGATWTETHLDFGKYGGLETKERRKNVKWAWCLWKVNLKFEKGEGNRIVSRATDFGGNTQLEGGVWNLRGVGYNAWGEVKNITII
jgi:sulfite oxidase